MYRNKILVHVLLAVFLLLSFLIFIFPGMPGGVTAFVTKVLLLAAVFGLAYSLTAGRYRIVLPGFINFDNQSDVDHSTDPDGIRSDYETFLAHDLRLISRQENVTNAYYYSYDTGRQSFTLVRSVLEDKYDLNEELPLDNELFSRVMQEGSPRLYDLDDRHNSLLNKIYSSGPMPRSIAVCPVNYNGQAIAVLAADTISFDAFDDDMLSFLEANSDIISSGMQYLDAIYRLDRKSEFFSRMASYNTALSLVTNSEGLYMELEKVCREFFDFDIMTVALMPQERNDRLHIVYRNENPVETVRMDRLSLDIGEGLPGLVMDKGEKAFPLEYGRDDKLDFRFKIGDLEQNPLKCVLAVPLKSAGKNIGALMLESLKSLNFTKKELEVLMIIGVNSASALHRIDLHRSVRSLESLDPLTAMLNGRAFRKRFFEEIQRAKRYELQLGFLHIDVQNYQQMSEMHGRNFTDRMTVQITSMLKEAVRDVDLIARPENSCFSVLLLKSRRSDTLRTAERIFEKLHMHEFSYRNISEEIRLQIKMANFPEDGSSIDALNASLKPIAPVKQSQKIGG